MTTMTMRKPIQNNKHDVDDDLPPLVAISSEDSDDDDDRLLTEQIERMGYTVIRD
jgi:hypothetical protein